MAGRFGKALAIGCVLACVASAAVLSLALVFGDGPRDVALGSSLSRAVNGAGGDCAERRVSDTYRCGIEIDAGSGFARIFHLEADGDCWEAVEEVRGRSNAVRRVRGCIDDRDESDPDQSLTQIHVRAS